MNVTLLLNSFKSQYAFHSIQELISLHNTQIKHKGVTTTVFHFLPCLTELQNEQM